MDLKFLNSSECKEKFADKKIYVFGAGLEGEKVYQKLSDTVTICAYIDNKRWGEENYFCGTEIISLEQFKLRRKNNEPIIVAAYRFYMDISVQLVGEGFAPEQDFFIWDDMNIFHKDDKTDRYIKFMSNFWKNDNEQKSEGIILIPFDNRNDLAYTAPYAYCANYLSKKYNASIYGFCKFGGNTKNAPQVILEIYQSFNLSGLVDSSLDKAMQEEADAILHDLWEKLFTWEDWKNITIFDICFGTTIIREFMREYIPDFDLRSVKMFNFLKKAVDTIVFWHHYIFENKIKTVLLADGVCWEGYIRDIAITKGIPTYAIEPMEKAYLNFLPAFNANFLYYKDMWKQLSAEEQQYGLEWAKRHINDRINGSMEDIGNVLVMNFPFAEKRKARVLDEDDKTKVIICPHIFEEDSYQCGPQIFNNCYWEWMCHLGEMSEKTPDYHWYFKPHPYARRRDLIIYEKYIKHYPRIKMLPKDISPQQLKDEGAKFALTVHGSIGHEYPAIGIEVINAGTNPHSAFNFTWNPITKDEYDDLIMNLDKLEPKNNMDELYQFYCMHYLFYDREYLSFNKIFFDNKFLPMFANELEVYGKELGTWKYDQYINEWSSEKHNELVNKMEQIFQQMDEWKPNTFYKRANWRDIS